MNEEHIVRKLCRHRVVLLILAIYMLVKGISYFDIIPRVEVLPRGVELITSIVSIQFWGIVWISIGCYLIYHAIKNTSINAYAAFSGLMIAWGAAHLYGSIEKIIIHSQRPVNITSGFGYVAFGLTVAILSNGMRYKTREVGDKNE